MQNCYGFYESLFFRLGRQLVEHNAVGNVYLHGSAVHDHGVLLKINAKEGHGIGLVIQADKEFVVREDLCILRVFAADGQAEILCKKSRLLVNVIDNYGIVTGIRAQKILVICGKAQGAGRVIASLRHGGRLNCLDLLKLRTSLFILITINIDKALPLMNDVDKLTVLRNLDVTGRRLKLGP